MPGVGDSLGPSSSLDNSGLDRATLPLAFGRPFPFQPSLGDVSKRTGICQDDVAKTLKELGMSDQRGVTQMHPAMATLSRSPSPTASNAAILVDNFGRHSCVTKEKINFRVAVI